MMDTYSSGEELIVKTRKPYTITKQRERWTEEEHNRFLEALKLYGRAWQRIEEHIGTKTAVQIRSHAQKFFSKLEKEAHAKGIPVGQALDIDIPPPRPKRKPSNPYPRKTGIGGLASQAGAKDGKLVRSVSSSHCKQALDLEKEPLPEKPNGDGKPSDAKENQDGNCSEVFTFVQEAHCSSMSSVNQNSAPARTALGNSCTFREFVPSLKQTIWENRTSKASDLEHSGPPQDKLMQVVQKDGPNDALPKDDLEGTQNYPRHVPVHVLDGSLGTHSPSPDMPLQDSIFHPMGEVHRHSNLFTNPAASGSTEHQNNAPRVTHQTFPTFHPPFAPVRPSQDGCNSFFHISSTFSSLIVSTLLQNPAAHAAASFAASFWPYATVDASACTAVGFAPRQGNSTPSMAAMAAATIAAATAWWAAHGLLPLCAPLHAAFTCPPTSTTVVPSTDIGQDPTAKTERKEGSIQNSPFQDQQLDPEHSEALQAQHSASKSLTSSSSDSEQSGGTKLTNALKVADHDKAAPVTELHDSNKTKSRKQVDRSSCGSNTPSSSEVETDALEKHEKAKEELKEADANHPATEFSNRRSRSSSNISDSWKEVSEEGRLAFQALFSREVLPQSFSPPHDLTNKEKQQDDTEEDKQNTDEKDADISALDLNSRTCGLSPDHQVVDKKALSTSEKIGEEGLLTIGLGHLILKARRTGFKPYKRCSAEAKENRVMNTTNQGEEKGPKRIRLEGDTST